MESKKLAVIRAVTTLWRGLVMWFLSSIFGGLILALIAQWLRHTAHVRYPLPFYFRTEFSVSIALIVGGFFASLTAGMRYSRRGAIWGLIYGLFSGAIVAILSTQGYRPLADIITPIIPAALGIMAGLGGGILGEKLSVSAPLDSQAYVTSDSDPAINVRLSVIENKLSGLEGIVSPAWISSIESKLQQLEARIESAGRVPTTADAGPSPLQRRDEQPAVPLPLQSRTESVLKSPAPSAKPFSLEDMLTAGMFTRVGIIALILGVAFFLKYAIENSWVGPMGRVAGGIILGIALILLGNKLYSKEFKGYGQSLMGGGLAILYLSLYSGFHFYDIISQFPAFILMVIVTAAATVLAIAHSSKIIAVTGILGGFLTPYLISTGVVAEVPLFTYLVVLNIGVVGTALYMGWREFGLFAFALTQIWLQGYFSTAYNPMFQATMFFFTTAYFVLFLAVTILYNVRKTIPSAPADLVLLCGNGFIYFMTVYYRLLEHTSFEYLESFMAIAMGALYLFTARYTLTRNNEDRYLVLAQLGMGAAFVTIAIPIALDWHWVTMGIAAEAVALFWLGFKYNDRWTRYGANALLATSCLRLLIYDSILRNGYAMLFTARSASFIFCLACVAAAARLYRLNSDKTKDDDSWSLPFMGTAWNLLLLFWLSVETRDFWKDYSLKHVLSNLNERINASYSVIWILYSFVLIGIGIYKKSKSCRNIAIGLFGIVTIKVFLVDLASLGLGLKMISFLVLGSILLLVSYTYQKHIGGKT